jgi:hypothetical protein
MIMQLKFKGSGLQRAVGYWAFAVLCGSAGVACSGSIETPTEENPRAQADDDEDEDATPAPRAPVASNDDDDDDPVVPPAGNDDDEDEPVVPPAGNDDDEEEPAAPPPAAGSLSFETDVYPIFTSNCAPCHTASALGGQSVGNDDLATALDDAKRIEDKLLSDLETGRMPSGCNEPPGGGGTCISAEEFATIEEWYAAGAPE